VLEQHKLLLNSFYKFADYLDGDSDENKKNQNVNNKTKTKADVISRAQTQHCPVKESSENRLIFDEVINARKLGA